MAEMRNELSYKKVHIEMLRIFACFMVFYNHTDGAIRDVAASDLSKSRVAAILLFIVCKTAVPVFLMIAGANLKRKNDSIKKSLERIGKTILLILVVSVFYHMYYYEKFNFSIFIGELISGKTTLAIWYLYAYLGIMVLLPILQRISISREMYLYIFAIHLLGPGLLPFLEFYLGFQIISPYILMTEISSYIVIFLLGDFIENEMEKQISTKYAVIAIILGICSLGASLGFAINRMKITGEVFDDGVYNQIYYTPTILLACSIFIICKYMLNKVQKGIWCSAVSLIGSYTLGIYILGDFLRQELCFVLDFLKQQMPEFVSVLLFDLFLLVCGILIMWLWNFLIKIFKVMGCNEKDI